MTDIIVVEDNIEMGSLLKDFLQSEGYSVEHFTTGEEAVGYYKTHGSKLLVLDVMLPKMDGLTACRTIRSFSDVPIIMLTAKSEERDELMGFEATQYPNHRFDKRWRECG